MCAWGFTVPVRKGRGGGEDPGPSSSSGGSASTRTPQLQQLEGTGEGEGADSEDEEYSIVRQRQRQSHHGGPLPPTGLVSPPSASNQLGYTIDLDREFGGEVRALWGFRTLNHVQSACFPVCYQTDHNVVVAGTCAA